MHADERIRIGIIGGSGLYDMADLTDREEREIATPFGAPSAPYVTGTLAGHRVAFLARHGEGHRLLPSELNFRANIFGMKTLGVEWLVSASAVGSLQEQYRPQDIVIPDDSSSTARGDASARSSGADSPRTSRSPTRSAQPSVSCRRRRKPRRRDRAPWRHLPLHGRTAVLDPGRIALYRSWNMDVIGMTNLQEAKLAREAEICFTTLALVTDYDCWHPDHDQVTVEMVIETLQANAVTAQQTIAEIVSHLPAERECECSNALATAIITRPEAIPPEVRAELAPIIGRYVQ